MIKQISVTENFRFGRKSIFYELLIFMTKNYEQFPVKTAHCI